MGGNVDKYKDLSAPTNMKLKCVAVFFRHGDRTLLTHSKAFDDVAYDPQHINVFPADMDIPIQVVGLDGSTFVTTCHEDSRRNGMHLPGGGKAGMLTDQGRKHSYKYGRSLKLKYMQPLGMNLDHFIPHEIYLRAKNLQRTVDTIHCVLAGMYGRAAFLGKLALVRVGTGEDDILNVSHKTKTIAQNFLSSSSPACVQLIPTTMTSSDLSSLHNKDRLKEQQQKMELLDKTLQATAGPLLSEVRRCLRSSIENPYSPKIYLFSCSDTTIVTLLKALGIFDGELPEFLTDLAFEVYQDEKGDHWIRIVYGGKAKNIGHLNTSLIPCHQFCQIIEPYISSPSNYVTRYQHIPS